MCQCGNGFNEARLFIINFITVDIDQSVVLSGQGKRFMQRLNAIFTRVTEWVPA